MTETASSLPRAVETAARKQRLLQAATELAAEGGYDAVQMRDVASRAEVALGTLYRHYSSKDQLLLAALASQADVLRSRLVTRPPRGETAATRVTDALRRANRSLDRRPRVTAAMVQALSSTEPAAAAVKLEVLEHLGAIIQGAIGPDPVEPLDPIVRVLGHVWFSCLAGWASGLLTADEMTAELDAAAHLLLP